VSAANAILSKITPPASRWRLWVDGSGGYLLLTGDSWTLGGISDRSVADIRVRADWPRLAGRIEREAGDYFWCEMYTKGQRPPDRSLVTHGRILPIAGSATLTLSQPSPLTSTAVLDLTPPHRFDEHIDRVILVDKTLLIGPSAECHIQCDPPKENVQQKEAGKRAASAAAAPPRLIMTRRGDRWLAGTAGDLQELVVGQSTQLQSVTMTLEET
jgi:hypothetical protein